MTTKIERRIRNGMFSVSTMRTRGLLTSDCRKELSDTEITAVEGYSPGYLRSYFRVIRLPPRNTGECGREIAENLQIDIGQF